MTNEEKILERLESLEKKITPIAESAVSLKELKEEMTPRVNEAVHALIIEMADIEADFQMENLTHLLKKAMRNVKNFSYAIDMMHNAIDFAANAEPLLKITVPRIISFLDDLEEKNIFLALNTGLNVLKSITEKYSAEEIEQIATGLGKLVDSLKYLTDEKAINLIEKASKIPASVNLDNAKPVGHFAMLTAMNDKDIKKGLGVVLELTKGLAALKEENQ